MTRRWRLVERICDWDGRPVAAVALPIHDDLPPGIYTVECIETSELRLVAGRNETELADAVRWENWCH